MCTGQFKGKITVNFLFHVLFLCNILIKFHVNCKYYLCYISIKLHVKCSCTGLMIVARNQCLNPVKAEFYIENYVCCVTLN